MIRTAEARDLHAALGVIRRAAQASLWLSRLEEPVQLALGGAGAEYRVLIAESAGTVAGVCVYAHVAGTEGTGAIHGVAVDGAREQDVSHRLLQRAIADLARMHLQIAVLEIPETLTARYERILRAGAFAAEARLEDYCADGETLVVYRAQLTS